MTRAGRSALGAAVEARGQRVGSAAARVAVRPALAAPPGRVGIAGRSIAEQVRHRVDRGAEVAYLEVEVRTCRTPGGADIADRLAADDARADRRGDPRLVCVPD